MIREQTAARFTQRAPESVLIDCLKAFDGGATSDVCLTRYPQQADGMRGVLDMRAQLLTFKTTTPSPANFAAGREALLARVVRPQAGSHPGAINTEAGRAHSQVWRPATRAAFAGALLFAMASCAIGVSATPVGDKVSEVLPNIPAIEVPEPGPIYPFPAYNAASPDMLPTTDPSAPIEVAPQPIEQQQSDPAVEPSETQLEPTKPGNPGDTWIPPTSFNETEEPEVETPAPSAQPEDNESSHQDVEQDDSSDDRADDEDSKSHDDEASSDDGENDGDDRSGHGETATEAAPSS